MPVLNCRNLDKNERAATGSLRTDFGKDPMAEDYRPIPYTLDRLPEEQLLTTAAQIFEEMDRRRSVRHFSDEPVPRRVIENAIAAASTAPSGANLQPWTFVLVGDPETKRRIRVAAEREEYENYEGGRLPADWLDALRPLGTDWRKPYLETAPWLIVVFEQRYGITVDGSRRKHFYVKESVGIACGFLIATLHRLGLAALTHTPSPMAFLSKVLNRPRNERAFVLMPVGYPADDCVVPAISRKPLADVLVNASGPDA